MEVAISTLFYYTPTLHCTYRCVIVMKWRWRHRPLTLLYHTYTSLYPYGIECQPTRRHLHLAWLFHTYGFIVPISKCICHAKWRSPPPLGMAFHTYGFIVPIGVVIANEVEVAISTLHDYNTPTLHCTHEV